MGLFLLHAFLLSRHKVKHFCSVYRGVTLFFSLDLQCAFFAHVHNNKDLPHWEQPAIVAHS